MAGETGASPDLFDGPDRSAMDFYKGRYFVINMYMLRFTGLWPYQTRITKLIIRAIFSSLIVVPGIPHMISAIVNRDDVELLLQGIGTFVYFITIAAKYFSMLFFENKMKFLYKNMVENWKVLENKAEVAILKKSGEMGRLLSIGYLGYMIGAVQAFVTLPLLPGMINRFFPSIVFLNDTKGRMLVLEGEYLVDREKYYYHIYLFETFVCIMTVPMFSTIDSTFAVCVEQCVGLLKVVNFGRILESSYSTSFLFVMLSATCTLITISVGILFNLHRPLFLLRFLLLLTGESMHIFFLSWPGQKLMDHSCAIFYAAQHLLKFIMRRSIKPMYLTSGGFYAMNFENYEKLMKSAFSYITVLGSFA